MLFIYLIDQGLSGPPNIVEAAEYRGLKFIIPASSSQMRQNALNLFSKKKSGVMKSRPENESSSSMAALLLRYFISAAALVCCCASDGGRIQDLSA